MSTAINATHDASTSEQHGLDIPPEINPASGSAGPAPEAVLLPPEELIIDENVRKSFDLGDHPEVTESIRRHGVLTPIKAHRETDGTITVVDGQVRTLTALAFDLHCVPVWITPAPAVDPSERAISRIAQQINVNDYRIGLTEGDRAAGMAQMFAFGASLTRISHDIGRKRDHVKLAVSVGGSDTARRAVDAGQLDFEQAAIIAEYEAVDDTDAVARLLAASRSMFSFEARHIAGARAEARQRLRESLPYAALGFGVLTSDPAPDDPRFISVVDLRTNDGIDVTDEQVHAAPQSWVVYTEPTDQEGVFDRDTGEPVAPDTVDWHTQGQPSTEAAEGLRHADTVERRPLWTVCYYLRADHLGSSGFRHESEFVTATEESEATEADPANDGDSEAPEATARAAERATARRVEQEREAERAAARKEEERQAARRVRELNKQGQAALEVRREFVTGFLARKTPPPLAAVFVAQSLADEPGLLDEFNADRTAHELLGINGWRSELLTSISTAKPARCQVIILGLVLGGYEKRTTKEAWRHTDRGVRRYLHFLADNGHHLTPVEQAAAGDLDPNTIAIDS